MEKAFALDPDSDEIAQSLGELYQYGRRYRDWEKLLNRMSSTRLAVNFWFKIESAEFKLAIGDAKAAQVLLDQIPLSYSPLPAIWNDRYTAALYLRDYDRAQQIIAATPAEWDYELFIGLPPNSYEEGLIAHYHGDERKARAIFHAVRRWSETAPGLSEDGRLIRLASCDAVLNDKKKAIAEGREAFTLVAKETGLYEVSPRDRALSLAKIYALAGEKALAIDQLEGLAQAPGQVFYGDLRLNPSWDSLRRETRFQKLVTSLKP